MKKSALLLLALCGCVRLSYVDIPAPYKFRYGEDDIVPCVKKVDEDLMCEKDGVTPANGILPSGNEAEGFYYRFFVNGKEIANQLYDENAGAGIKSWVASGEVMYTYCLDGKLCNISCNNVFDGERLYITGKALPIWVKAMGSDALKCSFIEDYLNKYYGKEKAKELASKNGRIADTTWSFIEELKEKQDK